MERTVETLGISEIGERFSAVVVDASALKRSIDQTCYDGADGLAAEAESLRGYCCAETAGKIHLTRKTYSQLEDRFRGMDARSVRSARVRLEGYRGDLDQKRRFGRALERFLKWKELLCRNVRRSNNIIDGPGDSQNALYCFYLMKYGKVMEELKIGEDEQRLLVSAMIISKTKSPTAILTKNFPLLYSYNQITRAELADGHTDARNCKAYIRRAANGFEEWVFK